MEGGDILKLIKNDFDSLNRAKEDKLFISENKLVERKSISDFLDSANVASKMITLSN